MRPVLEVLASAGELETTSSPKHAAGKAEETTQAYDLGILGTTLLLSLFYRRKSKAQKG